MYWTASRTLTLLGFVLALAANPWGTAWAQQYAAPGGVPYGSDGDCSSPIVACDLAGAVQDATDGGFSGNTVFVRLPNAGGVVFFNEDLVRGSNRQAHRARYLSRRRRPDHGGRGNGIHRR